MQFNPEVTVRMRGVMEKCTYCTQRINIAKSSAKLSKDDSIVDQLQTACEQACPTGAIVFGDIKNKHSKVSKKRHDKRGYLLLQEALNTKPRTMFLSKVINPIWNKKGNDNGHH